MTTARVCTLVAVALSLLSAATAAGAEESEFFVGVVAGHASYPSHPSININLPTGTLTNTGANSDAAAVGGDVGYRFNRYFAAELGYIDLGRLSAPLAGASASQGTAHFSVKGGRFDVVGTYPAGNWEPYLKFGFLAADVRLSASGLSGAAAFDVTRTSTRVTASGAAGVRYRLSDHWLAGLELSRYFHVGDRNTTGTASINAQTLSVIYRF